MGSSHAASLVVLTFLVASLLPQPGDARHFALSSIGVQVSSTDEKLPGKEPGRGPEKREIVESLPLFVDPLPIPPVIDTTAGGGTGILSVDEKAEGGSVPVRNQPVDVTWNKTQADGGIAITIGAHETRWQFHRDLPPSPVYAFGATYESASIPGPTIVVASGQTLHVHWANNITAARHLFPEDRTLGVPKKETGVPMVIHVHGHHSQSFYDGHPLAWYTHNGTTGPTYVSDVYTYHNIQPAATLWYHDHTMGMTRLNVQAGLFGGYIIKEDAFELPLSLPSGEFDVPLIFHDKMFYEDGSIFVPETGGNPHLHPHWVPEEFGHFVTVNGKVSPYMEVQPRKYLFRLINGCLARFLNLSLPLNTTTSPSPSPVLTFTQVSSDSSYLPRPVTHTHYVIAPGDRAGIVIDFSLLPVGTSLTFLNSANSPFPDGDPVTGMSSQVMEFRVVPVKKVNAVNDSSSEGGGLTLPVSDPPIPDVLLELPPADPSAAVNYPAGRDIVLTEIINVVTDEPEVSLIDGKHYKEPADIKVHYGETEIWNIINLTGDAHPIHIHFVMHRALYRRSFDQPAYEAGNCTLTNGMAGSIGGKDAVGSGVSCLSGAEEPVLADEVGWTDTTIAYPGQVTVLMINFTLPVTGDLPFDPSSGLGYVIHCHILNHEDNDMMRPFLVLPPRDVLRQAQSVASLVLP